MPDKIDLSAKTDRELLLLTAMAVNTLGESVVTVKEDIRVLSVAYAKSQILWQVTSEMLDNLRKEHEARMASGQCVQVNGVSSLPTSWRGILRPSVPISLGGVLIIIILLILKSMGLTFSL